MNCINLKTQFGDRFKIGHEQSYRVERSEFRTAEEVWLQIIPCRGGHIFPYGGSLLAASTDKRGSLAKRLRALPGVQVVQDGDDGATILFDIQHFQEVAEILHPRRRRRLSPEARQAAVRRLEPYQFQPQ